MTAEATVTGLFKAESQALAALEAARQASWSVVNVYSPIPSDDLEAALKRPASKLGYFTLAGGILGFFCGFLLAAFTSSRWELIVSGKPVVSLVPFFIVGFEFTILFGVLFNVVGLILLGRLPGKVPPDYDPQAAGDHYMISVACPAGKQATVRNFLEAQGARIASSATQGDPK